MALKVTADEPGRRLILVTGEVERRLPPEGCLAGVFAVFLFLQGLSLLREIASGAHHPLRAGFAVLVLATLLALVVRAAARGAFRGHERVRRLDFDREQGLVRLHTAGRFLGRERQTAIPPAEIRSASLRTEPRLAQGGLPVLRLRLAFGPESAPRDTDLVFCVEQLTRREEMADLALRLAAVLELPFLRVVRNDPRDFEAALDRAYAPGAERVRAPEGPADYARDAVTARARAAVAEERVPAFDPASFPGRYRVREWRPGRRVRIRKPLSPAVVPAVALALLGGLGSLAPLLLGDAALRLTVLLIALPFTLSLLGLGAWLAWRALPREAVFDWLPARLTLRRPFRRTAVPFPEVASLEMRGQVRVRRQGRNEERFHRCVVSVAFRGAPGGPARLEVLAETPEFRDDPDQPYRLALPLVTELAEAVPARRLIEE